MLNKLELTQMTDMERLLRDCEHLRIDVERYKASAGMWRNKCYELGGTPLPWEPEELIQKAVKAEREACAQICDHVATLPNDLMTDALYIAKVIRARGEK